MAGDTKQTEVKINDLIDKLSRSQREQERAIARVTKALDTLSESTIIRLQKSLTDAAKDTGFLNDEQVALIKSSKDLAKAIEKQESNTEIASIALEKYKTQVDAIVKSEKNEINQARKLANAAKLFQTELEVLGFESKEHIELMVESNKAFNDQAEALVKNAESMDYFTSNIDQASKASKGWLAKTFTLTTAFELLKNSVTQQIAELNKATSVGLQDSFASIGWEAMKLKMTFDEFNDLISKNRDIVNQLGAGSAGVKNFSALISKSSSDLAYMGKDGILATGRFIGTLKTMGMTASDSTKNSIEYSKAMKSTQKHFKEFSAIYGDNYDQFADLIESQMMSENTQSRLTGLNKIQAGQLREEIMLRTDSLKALGLSNDQIRDFGKRLDDTFDPKKNEQSEKISQAEMFKSQLAEISRLQPANKEFQGSIKHLQEYANAVAGGAQKDELAQLRADYANDFRNLGSALDKNNQIQKELRDQGKTNRASMIQYVANSLGEKSEKFFGDARQYGTDLNLAKKQGLGLTGVDDVKATREAAVKGAEAQDLYTKSVIAARDVTQTVSAIMANSLVGAFLGGGAAIGYLSMASIRGAKAIDFFAAKLSGAPTQPGGSSPTGKMGGKLGMLGKVAGGLGVAYGAYNTYEQAKEGDTTSALLSGATTGAGLGFMVGGPLGAAIGGAAGGLLGAGGSMLSNRNSSLNPPVGASHTSLSSVPGHPTTAITSSPSVYQPIQPTNSQTDNAVINELKKQTGMLATIAQNTKYTFKPPEQQGKHSPGFVANNVQKRSS